MKCDVDDIYKPLPINDNGKPMKGSSIFLDTKLPLFLYAEKEKSAYEIVRIDGTVAATVSNTFPKDVREYIESLGGKFRIISRVRTNPVRMIDNVKVTIRNSNWENKWVIIINTGTINEIIEGTKKVLNYLLENGVIINKNDVCQNYCGLTVDNDNVNKLKKHKRK